MLHKNILTVKNKAEAGFALISTIIVMALLLVLSLSMMSLSRITTRDSSIGNAQLRAEANAKMALMFALAELQEAAGSDQRITANGSILLEDGDDTPDNPKANAVGVWESWSPELTSDTSNTDAGAYDAKADLFVRWLRSGNEDDLTDQDWPTTGSDVEGNQDTIIDLFGTEIDGFSLTGDIINIDTNNNQGGLAWAISQENTKAKLNIAGPQVTDRSLNDDLRAQPRGNLSLSDIFTQPEDETGGNNWNERAARILDYRQVELDELISTGDFVTGGADFTTSSFGLLTDVVNGGLKVDMSLGFEMSDSDFDTEEWDGFQNPFHNGSVTAFETPTSYQTQRPLYEPITDTGTFSHERVWSGEVDQVHSFFPVTSVPTFHTLRSFYRIPHHLYQSSEGGITVFEREGDHIAAEEGTLSPGFTRPPHRAARGQETQMSIRPVLDRAIFVFSLALNDDNEPQFAVTPIISLWNPYNISLEIEGAVAYPWLDLPIFRRFRGTHSGGANLNRGSFISRDFLVGGGNGRQIPPYVIGAITADGNPISGNVDPIRLEPGEVRVFAPAVNQLQEYTASGASLRERTVFMKPVDGIADYNTAGGLNVTPANNGNQGRSLQSGDEVRLELDFLTSNNFPISIALTDTELAKGSSPTSNDRGMVIADVLGSNFAETALQSGQTLEIETRNVSFAELLDGPAPVFSLEVYHRVTKSGDVDANLQADAVAQSDIMLTGNPRQGSINPVVANTDFQAGPQYQIRFREISSVDNIMEISDGQGENGDRVAAFYGAAQSSAEGRSHLSFFEVPREPLISLAALQHADLAPTTYAPANQFGNSWASAYVPRDSVVDGNDGLEVDHTYLVNEALWDGFFFSSASPVLSPANSGGSADVWDNTIANEDRSLENVLTDFAEDPSENPLRNSRMQLISSSLEGMTPEEFATEMIEPEAALKIAAHLMVDGAFNINSTSEEAWEALLAGLKGSSFNLGNENDATIAVTNTPFPRFRNPLGVENDIWQGFRSLSDEEIEELASNIVEQVKQRGPFLSLGEFVNRQVVGGDLGLNGTLQAAINETAVNDDALENELDTDRYEGNEADNIFPKNTGVGIPGYLTQADLLQSIAPVITPRSDTFTIRAYGDARNSSGEIIATSWIEATVQRFPNFVDDSEPAYTQTEALSEINQRFGREFRVVYFRYLNSTEAQALSE